MKKHNSFYAHIIVCLITLSLFADENNKKNNTINNANKDSVIEQEEKIDFIYKEKPLIDIVHELAALKNLNVILPQGDSAKGLQAKVTFSLPKKITIDFAWNTLLSLLSLADYTIVPQGNMIEIVSSLQKNNIIRQPLELFVNTPAHELPDTDQVIRYILYFKNLNINTQVTKDKISVILQDMLSIKPTNAAKAAASDVIFDPKTNAVIVTSHANNLREIIQLIQALDQGGFPDAIEIVPLYYTQSTWVDSLFNGPGGIYGKQQTRPEQKELLAPYFPDPKGTRILPLTRTNSMVIMGTTRSIDIIKDFIVKYLDKPPESGNSVLHVYDLQYLKAQDITQTLINILGANKAGDQSQTKTTAKTGPKQYFKDVIIVAEQDTQGGSPTTKQITPTKKGFIEVVEQQIQTEEGTGTTIGGNRLIIAAHKKDWVRIKRLIQQLDTPQLQVALEVLILDVNLERDKQLGSSMRNKESLTNDSENLNWQTAHLREPLLKPTQPTADGGIFNFTPATSSTNGLPPNALMANLLQRPESDLDPMLLPLSTPGAFVFSINDPCGMTGVWSFWRLLNSFTNLTILSQPYIITQNHQQASISQEQNRFLPGQAQADNVGAVIIQNENVSAALSIDLLPHISRDGTINLQIVVTINEFTNAPQAATPTQQQQTQNQNRITRVLQTSAHIGDGEILALGGLTRQNTNITQTETPPFSNIPILGWFFKNKAKEVTKNNLLILISPTIIAPYTKGRLDDYSCNKINLAKDLVDEGLNLDNLRDPITRWFFKPETSLSCETIDAYVDEEYHYAETYQKEKKQWKNTIENTRRNKRARNARAKAEVRTIQKQRQANKMHTKGMDINPSQTLKELIKDEDNPLTRNAEQFAQSDKKQEETARA